MDNKKEMEKAEKLGAFFGKMMDLGLGVHPDAGHDYQTAELQRNAYRREIRQAEPTYPDNWKPL